jgi:NitT/TauT family transport system substrate-binding protein
MNYAVSLMGALGLDRKYGIDAKIFYLGFGQAAQALQLGEVDIGVLADAAAVKMTKAGTPVKIVTPFVWSGNAFVVRKDSPYKKLADLKGKKIGNFSRVTGAYFFSSVLAKMSGLDIEKDFDLFVGGTAALIAVLERGEVEAINMYPPYVSKLLVTGKYRVLVDFDSEFAKLMGSKPHKAGYGARTYWLANPDNAETARRWRKAVSEVIQYIKERNDKDFFYKNAGKIFGLETKELMDTVWEVNYRQYVTAAEFTPTVVKKQKELLQKGIDLGLLPEGASVDIYWELPISSR